MTYVSKDNAIASAIDACVEILGHGITQFEAVKIADIMEKFQMLMSLREARMLALSEES